MAIEFDFYVDPDSTGEGKEKYHARTITRRTVTTQEMAEQIHSGSSLTISDVKSVLIALTEEIIHNLSDSNRVHLEGIGYLQVTVKASREIDPKKTHAQSVWFKSVSFRADKSLKKRLADVLTKRSEHKAHSAKLTNEQVDKKVWNYFKENQILNTRSMQFLCGFSQYAAGKHIKRLVEEGKIKNINTKKNPVYVKV